MVDPIRPLLEARPFVPFYVLTSGGNRYRVMSADHADINPRGTQVVIWFDDDSSIIVSAFHIVAVEREATQPA